MYFHTNIPTYLIPAIIIMIIAIYLSSSLILNSYHKLLYKKNSIIAFIPILNIYLLGKLCINKLLGWLMIFWIIMLLEVNVTINYRPYDFAIIPDGIFKNILFIIYFLMILSMYIYVIIKLYKSSK